MLKGTLTTNVQMQCNSHSWVAMRRRALRRADAQRKLAVLRPAPDAGDDVSEAGYGPLYSPQPGSPAHGAAAKVNECRVGSKLIGLRFIWRGLYLYVSGLGRSSSTDGGPGS